MEQATQIRLVRKVHELLAADSTDMVECEVRQEIGVYTSPARLKREQESLFRKYPLIVGRSEQLVKEGDFLTLNVADLPVLITRDGKGRLHAMINVCRHRGTQVVNAPAGCRKIFVCPYHAWNYDLAGRLTRVTDEEGFPNLDKSQHGLKRLPVAERHGFIWLIPDGAATLTPEDVAVHLGELDRDFNAFDLQKHIVYNPVQMRLALNWKLAFDIFLEAYHVRYAHTQSIYPLFFDNVGVFERFGRHMRNLFPKRSIKGLAGVAESDWRLREHSNILYFFFPNTLMLVEPDHASMFHVYPDGAGACRIETYTLLPELPTSEKATAYWQKNIDILFAAIREDFALGESIQRGFASGANTHFTFGRYEQSLAWFHESVEAALT